MPSDRGPIDPKKILGDTVEDADLELESRKDNYYLKRSWKKSGQILGEQLPLFFWLAIGLPFIFIVWRYVWFLEDRVERVLINVLWTFVTYAVGLATPYLKKILKNEA